MKIRRRLHIFWSVRRFPSDVFGGPSEHKHFIYIDKAFARLLHHYTTATTTTYTYIQFAVSRAKRPELVYRFRDPKGTFKKTVSRRSIIPHRVRTDADRPSDVNYVNKNENNKGPRAYSDRIMHYIHVYIYILYVFSSLPPSSLSMPIRIGRMCILVEQSCTI
jgi:hypothetical protein